ncbi:hypothetical protein SVAN01_10253 [Stagonosporopsis vannaccii]|nr:hypothetical protein SVAN01_10253 [Stagonosporopsis vannaccii]
MPQISGPFDGRKARKKRCNRCVERRIKCVGGRPCLNCSRTNHLCHTTAKPESTAWVFVHATKTQDSDDKRARRKGDTVSLPRQIPALRNETHLTYFFTSFLSQNAFTSVSEQFRISLSSLIYGSVGLRDAINAISALHIAQMRGATPTKGDDPAALHAYARSVKCIQAKITSGSIVRDPSSLWTTLLLGVFELMRDPTGRNWLAHFLHGTSTMLCLQGPDMLLHSSKENEHHHAFFFSARIFEISRALIYTEPTFLATPEWSAAIEAYWTQHPSTLTPKEALFNILPQFVELAMRTHKFVVEAEGILLQDRYYTAASLAQEGLALESELNSWYTVFSSWTAAQTDKSGPDPESSIALLYYHTISIYLDGIFSYHAPFTTSVPISPILDRAVVESHVDSILTLSQEMLAQGCAGILLFFPLRVAGARARDIETRLSILRILDLITQRGFTVAQSFVTDLSNLWGI